MSEDPAVYAIGTPQLTDGVVVARPWCPEDAPALYQAARESIVTVGQWLPWLDSSYSPQHSERWIIDVQRHWQARSEFPFGVFSATDGSCLGGVGLNHINTMHRLANLGYWVRASATGRGVASRAARLAARFGLTEAKFGRIEILTAVDNRASQKVAIAVGAHFDGVLRDRLLHGGSWISAHLYSLIRDDLPQLEAAIARRTEP
jgi:ribosomal-protein-serine acetyltransferase